MPTEAEQVVEALKDPIGDHDVCSNCSQSWIEHPKHPERWNCVCDDCAAALRVADACPGFSHA